MSNSAVTSTATTKTGAVTLVATPIGNLDDITLRALHILRTADVIACEDTRHSRALFARHHITPSELVALHEHNEARVAEELATRAAREHIHIAYITDAGTPGISDPGERLVRACIARNVAVTVAPGVSAAISALVVSGLPTDRFFFEGFLPRKGRERAERLAHLASQLCTTILYESPRRLVATATELLSLCDPHRPLVLVRELTKLYEEVWRGTLAEFVAYVDPVASETHTTPTTPIVRGECVLLLGPATPSPLPTDDDIRTALRDAVAYGMSRKDAAAHVAQQLGVAKNRAYFLLD